MAIKSIIKSIYKNIGIQYCPPNTLLGRLNRLALNIWWTICSIRDTPPNSVAPDPILEMGLHVYHTSDKSKYSPGPSELDILILKLDGIGDFITAVPAFMLLRRLWPNAKLHLVCKPFLLGLASQLQIFSKITPYKFSPSESKILRGKPRESTPNFPLHLTKTHFDFAIDLRHDYDTRKLLSGVTATYKIGFLGEKNSPQILDITLPPLVWNKIDSPALPPPPHAKDLLLLLVHRLAEHFTPMYFPKDTMISGLTSSMYVGIGIGASAPTRQWNIGNFATLIKKLQSNFAASIILYGGEDDVEFSQAILNQIDDSDKVLNNVGKFPLEQLPIQFQKLSLFIGHDSGLTHLAAALGIPTVGLYPGVGNFPVWRPSGKNVTTLNVSPFCSPCNIRSIRDCKFNMMCFKPITPDEVFNACAKALKILQP